MAEKKAGIIVILSSPSGAGKTTLVKKISSRKKYIISISHTTRKPRVNEKNGKDYFLDFSKRNKLSIHQFIFSHYKKQTENNPSSMAIFEKTLRTIANLSLIHI